MAHHRLRAGVVASAEALLFALAACVYSSTEVQPTAAAATAVAPKPQESQIEIAPFLGPFDADSFTVACRTKSPTLVTISRAPAETDAAEVVVADSVPARMHRLTVPRASGVGASYFLTVSADGERVPLAAPQPIARGEKFTFAALGDSRGNGQKWAAVAAAAAVARPRFILFLGDFVFNGANIGSWEKSFFTPAGDLFATVPLLAVVGNHEESGSVFNDLFCDRGPEGPKRNWVQRMGDVTLIGIAGNGNWSAGSANSQWLEGVLAAADTDSKYVFLASHYPPWSSGPHGAVDSHGVPMEWPVREGREVILPLLAKYRATAFIAGHDHAYERSEPEGGVTVVVTGGAGAPLYSKSASAAKSNPWSRVFASQFHYCLFEVSADTCRMRVFGLDGAQIDERTWPAR